MTWREPQPNDVTPNFPDVEDGEPDTASDPDEMAGPDASEPEIDDDV